jgi:hypothetical protein
VSTNENWKKIVPERASDIIDAEELDPASAQFLSPETRPEELILGLTRARRWPDAVAVLSRALPAREAVWWACVCARHMESLSGDESETTALEAAEHWVFRPNDENRRAALDLAQGNTSKSAGTLAALGVAFSDGTMPVPDEDHVEVDPAAFPQIVAAAVMVAATEKKGEQIHERFALFMRSGEDIACGGNGQVEGMVG